MQTKSLRPLVFTALFAALFIVMSLIAVRLSLSAVPITLQTLAVMAAGIFLMPRHAFMSIFSVIVLAAFGLPLFNGNGGLAYLFGPTGGFIMSFPFIAMLVSLTVGWLLQTSLARRSILSFVVFFVLFVLLGLLAYIPGLPWMMHVLGFTMPKALAAGFVPFIIGDLLKAATASALTTALVPYIKRVRSTEAANSLATVPTVPTVK